MIPLSKAFVNRIERTLEPGFVVQLEEVGTDVLIKKFPRDESNIYITPVLASLEDRTMLLMTLKKPGEDPVELPPVTLPEAYWITGIMGSRNQPPAGDFVGDETPITQHQGMNEAVKKRLTRGD